MMCWGVYGKVLDVLGDMARVEFGGGVVKEVLSGVDELRPGDYVIVHAGIVISRLNEEEFLQSFRYLREMAEMLVREGELSPEELKEMDEQVERWTRKQNK